MNEHTEFRNRIRKLEEKVATLEKKLSALEDFTGAEYVDSPRYEKRSNKNEVSNH